jgi:ArsR family transcriptional regulator, arsenate/arsenite/antimonite-responsive transcriptional repressor
MDTNSAVTALAALAQPTRLEAFRLLVRTCPEGLPAGAIARTLGVPHNTMSSHLGVLTQAGLAASARDGRSVIYRVDVDGTRALLGFLVEDCCRGRPEMTASLLDGLMSEGDEAPR